MDKLYLKERIKAFVTLGTIFKILSDDQRKSGDNRFLSDGEAALLENALTYSKAKNGWFTEQNVQLSLSHWADQLAEDKLLVWLDGNLADNGNQKPKTVAVIMAGNVPLVGFHDFLSVVLSGNKCLVKLSSDDSTLLPAFIKVLVNYYPELSDYFEFTEGKLQNFDAIIATGSNNSARYFETYFGKYPHVIRKNRNAVAVLSGAESDIELNLLGDDVFQFFGLGCRNVSKLFLPEGYDLNKIFGAWFDFHAIVNHNKYANNYDYNKAIYLLNKDDVLENGFVLLKRDKAISSPIAVVHYEYYSDLDYVQTILSEQAESIQCVVGYGGIPYGTAQKPGLADYADGVDTLSFLKSLHSTKQHS